VFLSLEEKKRRYSAVNDALKKSHLSGLLIFSNAQVNQQGYVRYFTDLPIPIYSHALLFIPDGEPFLFTPSPLQTYWAKRRAWIAEDRIKLSRDAGQEMGIIIKGLKKGEESFGVLNFDTMGAKDYRALTILCPGIQLVDATSLMEDIRRQKSAEEIDLVRTSAEIAMLSREIINREMKVGISEEELCAKVEEAVRAHGAERTFYLISSSPGGLFPYVPGTQKLDGVSPVLFSIEVSGRGGYWTQMVRTYFWQTPQGTLLNMHQTLKEIMDVARQELRPGQKVAHVAEKMRAIIQERGFEYGVHFGHGLGLDVVEESLINTMNNSILLPDQIITVHPHLIHEKESLGIWTGDTFLIRENETINLTSNMPQDI